MFIVSVRNRDYKYGKGEKRDGGDGGDYADR